MQEKSRGSSFTHLARIADSIYNGLIEIQSLMFLRIMSNGNTGANLYFTSIRRLVAEDHS